MPYLPASVLPVGSSKIVNKHVMTGSSGEVHGLQSRVRGFDSRSGLSYSSFHEHSGERFKATVRSVIRKGSGAVSKAVRADGVGFESSALRQQVEAE